MNIAWDYSSLCFLSWEEEGQSQFALVDQTVFLGPAGSHSNHCYCRGYSHWHFLLAGILKTLPWPLSVHPSFFFHCFFFSLIFLFALTLSSIQSSFKSCSLPLIFSLSLSEFVFILTAPLPLCSTYRSISSLSFLIQHPPDYSLCLHASSSFCPLRFSKPQPLSLCLLPALPLLSVFQTLPPLVFHFSLIHNKTGLHLERGSVRPFLSPFSVLFQTTSTGHFLSFCSQTISAAALEANKLARLQFSWYAFCWDK